MSIYIFVNSPLCVLQPTLTCPAFPSLSVCGAWTGMCTASLAVATGIFFHKSQLRRGSTMALSFPAEAEPPILSHDVAEKVSFANLSDVLATFDIPTGSAEAGHVAATLSLCQSPPHAGELKACATSLESTVRKSMGMLGATDHGVWAATSSVLPVGGGLPRQLYQVQAVTPLDGDHYVGCHKVPFPYCVYQCHMTAATSVKAYVVSLRGVGRGPNAEMLAFCHLDTSKWNPAHPAFERCCVRNLERPCATSCPTATRCLVKRIRPRRKMLRRAYNL